MADERLPHVISIREYVDQQITALSTRLDDQRRYTEKAVEKAEIALGKRLDGMNEFREALKDQASRMATRTELDGLRERLSEIDKRSGITAATVSIIVSLLASLVVGLLIRWTGT